MFELDHSAHCVTRAIAKATQSYHDTYWKQPGHYDTNFWLLVFLRFFGEPPTSIHDPRWDTLLFQKTGHGALSLAEEFRRHTT